MNIIPNSTPRAASPAAYRFLKTESARVPREAPGFSSHDGKATPRVPYANALYAAAIAALLSACAQSDVTSAPEAAIVQPAGQSIEATADLPTVVITASRERSKAIG